MYGMFGSDCGAMPLSVEKRSSPPTNQNANAIAAVIAILLSKFRIFNLPTTLATTIILAVGYIKMFLNIRFHWQRNRLRIFSLSFCNFFIWILELAYSIFIELLNTYIWAPTTLDKS
jgi:hypothetical protein